MRGPESSALKTTPRARPADLPRKRSRSGRLPRGLVIAAVAGWVGMSGSEDARSQDTGHRRIYSNTSVIRGATTADSINFGLRSCCYCSYLTATTLRKSTLCPVLRMTQVHALISSRSAKKRETEQKQKGLNELFSTRAVRISTSVDLESDGRQNNRM